MILDPETVGSERYALLQHNFPSLRLFRQKREGDWSGLLTAVGQALREKFDL